MKFAEAFPLPSNFVDRRAFASKRPGGNATRPRRWSSVSGICLHQTACVLGTRDARWDTLGAHFGVMRTGRVVWLHGLDRLVWHAQGLSHGTVGIEIDGLFPGLVGGSVWDNPETDHAEQATPLLDAQVTATVELCRWIATEVQANGGEVKALVAHRQSSATRRDDPGAEIWKRIALPVSEELGLSDGGPGFKLGDGRAIPEGWDSSRKGERY